MDFGRFLEASWEEKTSQNGTKIEPQRQRKFYRHFRGVLGRPGVLPALPGAFSGAPGGGAQDLSPPGTLLHPTPPPGSHWGGLQGGYALDYDTTRNRSESESERERREERKRKGTAKKAEAKTRRKKRKRKGTAKKTEAKAKKERPLAHAEQVGGFLK